MPTTTIRLTEEMKVRIALAAERAGTTSHNFMLQAITEKTEMDERRQEFDTVAEQRFARIVENRQTIPWDAMRAYLGKRARGTVAKRPASKKLTP